MPALPDNLTALAQRLEDALDARAPKLREFHDAYVGNHSLHFVTQKYRETFGRLLNALADNWCQIVVDASVERLRIEGFRFGRDEAADSEAWMLWQANALDADAPLAHTEAGTSGISYLLVTPSGDPETPRITVESPLEAIALSTPENRRDRVAGLKRWEEDDGTVRAVLYTRQAFYRIERERRSDGSRASWTVEATVRNDTGAVPLVPMINNPQLLGGGMSDLVVVLPLQDAVNKLLADMIVNSEFVAFPQRWATGIELPRDENGRVLDRETFLSSVSRLWVAEDESVKFGELPGWDGSGYIRSVEALVQHIAALTRTPPHYLLGQSGNFPSGESLKATETGLVAKVQRKQATYGEAWEEAMRIAFAFRGDVARAQAFDAETIWHDPESRSEGELVDALVKMRDLSVPLEALWARWGVSPQEIERWKTLLKLPNREPVSIPAGGSNGAQAQAANEPEDRSPQGDDE